MKKKDRSENANVEEPVSGAELAAFVRQTRPDGPVNVSLRTLPPHDAAAICAEWDGGGHERAAGATLHVPLAEALRTVRERLAAAAAGR